MFSGVNCFLKKHTSIGMECARTFEKHRFVFDVFIFYSKMDRCHWTNTPLSKYRVKQNKNRKKEKKMVRNIKILDRLIKCRVRRTWKSNQWTCEPCMPCQRHFSIAFSIERLIFACVILGENSLVFFLFVFFLSLFLFFILSLFVYCFVNTLNLLIFHIFSVIIVHHLLRSNVQFDSVVVFHLNFLFSLAFSLVVCLAVLLFRSPPNNNSTCSCVLSPSYSKPFECYNVIYSDGMTGNIHWNGWNNRISWRNDSVMTASIFAIVDSIRCPCEMWRKTCWEKKNKKNNETFSWNNCWDRTEFEKDSCRKSNNIEQNAIQFRRCKSIWSWRSIKAPCVFTSLFHIHSSVQMECAINEIEPSSFCAIMV